MTYEMQLSQAAGLTAVNTAAALGNAAPPLANKPQGLKKIHRLLRGRYAWVFGLGLVFGAIGATWGWLAPKMTFRSEGTIEVNPVIPSASAILSPSLPDPLTFINSQIFKLTSHDAVQGAMGLDAWHDLNTHYTEDQFAGNLDVEVSPGTYIIKITYTDYTPKVAFMAVQSICEWYKHQAVEPLLLSQREEKLQNELQTVMQRRSQAQSDIDNINKAWQTDDLKGVLQQQNMLLDRLAEELRVARADLESTLVSMQLPTDELKAVPLVLLREPKSSDTHAGGQQVGGDGALATRPADAEQVTNQIALPKFVEAPARLPTSRQATKASRTDQEIATSNPRMRALIDMRDQQIRQITNLKISGFLDSHPQVQRARDFVTELQQEIADYTDEVNESATPDAPGVQSDLSYKWRHLQNIILEWNLVNTELPRLQEAVATVRQSQAAFEGADATRQELEGMVRQLERQHVLMDIDPTVSVHEPIDAPTTPTNDLRKKLAAMGFVCGALVPTFVLLVIGFLDGRYRYSDETNHQLAGIPLLGILPNLPDLLTDPEQAATAAHCVHQIRTLLQITGHNLDRRVFAITSGSPGDGKTSLALALGLSFSASGSRTLLIDGDLVGAGLTARLNITADHGVLEAMATLDILPLIRPTDVSGLSIMPVGQAMGPYSGTIAPMAVRRMVTAAREHFDVIIVDTGPILGSIEASPISVAADGVILCVSRGQQRQLVDRSLAHLQAIGAKLAGVVFNRAQAQDFDRSASRMSTKPLTVTTTTSTNGHRSEHMGPVAKAVATSVRSSGPGNSNGSN